MKDYDMYDTDSILKAMTKYDNILKLDENKIILEEKLKKDFSDPLLVQFINDNYLLYTVRHSVYLIFYRR